MAQVITETITLAFSRLVKDAAVPDSVFTSDLLADIESAASALAGAGIIVEIRSYTTNSEE
jgi:hypothetical protein